MPTADTIISWLQNFAAFLPWLGAILVATVLIAVLIVSLLRILDRRRLLHQKSVFLELTPPANTNKSREATQRFFSALHGLEAGRSLTDKLLGRKVVFSLEVYSAKNKGIPYIVRVPEQYVGTFEDMFTSYLPDARCKQVKDYVPENMNGRVRALDIKQTGHFAYPLQNQGDLEEHDAMAYLLGAMTKLDSGELIGVQVVVSPANVRKARELSARLLRNEEMLHTLGKRQSSVVGAVFNGINTVLFGILTSIGDVVSGPSRGNYRSGQAQVSHRQQVAMGIKPARILSPLEQKLADSVQDKLNQPLFRVNIRVLIATNNKQNEKQRVSGIRDWLALFNVAGYQALRVRFTPLRSKRRIAAFTHRLPSLLHRSTALLAASEIADLYHFPHAQSARADNVLKSLSKTLPAPVSLKNGTKLDVVLGRNHHHGVSTDIGLTAAERERHVFIVGGTGNGKTTLLKYAIVQDIKNGKGVAVVDPHGDLAQELLEHIPKERINDVIYFNPADFSYPIGMNLLEIPPGLTGDQLLDAKDFIAEMVVSIMRKTFSDDGTGGHRIEYVLRNAVLTALTVKDATIFTVYDLLTDKDYRTPIVNKLEQDWLKNFWRNEFGKAGDYQQVKMMSGVTSKIGRYHASVAAERALEQPRSTINFDEVLDGKILICNLAKGLIGEDTSEVLGISVLAQLQLAAYKRIKQKRAERRPFYAYVDEFQNFATMSFVEMLSEARKYKLFLTMAEQTTSQQDDAKMVNIITANAGTIICFKSNSLADERQMLHLFNGHVQPGEISNLPAYNFYAKLSGGAEPQEPLSGETIVVEDGDEDITKEVIKASRKNYAKKYVAPKKKAASNNKGSGQKKAANTSESGGGVLLADSEGATG